MGGVCGNVERGGGPRAAYCPRCAHTPASAGRRHIQSSPDRKTWRVFTATTDVLYQRGRGFQITIAYPGAVLCIAQYSAFGVTSGVCCLYHRPGGFQCLLALRVCGPESPSADRKGGILAAHIVAHGLQGVPRRYHSPLLRRKGVDGVPSGGEKNS